jgi:cytoskeletal protein CcmA (bactofilin family)
MKRNRLPLLIALLSLYLTACGSDGLYRFTLITNGEHVLDGDMTGDLIVTDGSAALPAGARLIGNIHLLSGSLIVDGRIRGDIFFLNGDLTIGPAAHINGDLNLGSEIPTTPTSNPIAPLTRL